MEVALVSSAKAANLGEQLVALQIRSLRYEACNL